MIKVIKIIQPSVDYSILMPYLDQWVALTRDRKKVIASDKDGGKLMKKLDKMGIRKEKTVLKYVFDPGKTYSL